MLSIMVGGKAEKTKALCIDLDKMGISKSEG